LKLSLTLLNVEHNLAILKRYHTNIEPWDSSKTRPIAIKYMYLVLVHTQIESNQDTWRGYTQWRSTLY